MPPANGCHRTWVDRSPHAERRRRLEDRPQRCPGTATWSVRPRARMVAAPESQPGRSARENGPEPRPAAVTFATSQHYVIRLILRICVSKIRAGTRRWSMLTRPAPSLRCTAALVLRRLPPRRSPWRSRRDRSRSSSPPPGWLRRSAAPARRPAVGSHPAPRSRRSRCSC
jgi:hypothetical protein